MLCCHSQMLHSSHSLSNVLCMYSHGVCIISSPIIEISLWICAIDKQPQPLDLVNCSATAEWITMKLCTLIAVPYSYKTSPYTCLSASLLWCCAPGYTNLTTHAHILYHIRYGSGIFCFIFRLILRWSLQSFTLIHEHVKAQ